jgi:hypothetical protein
MSPDRDGVFARPLPPELVSWLWYGPLNVLALCLAYGMASLFRGISTSGQAAGEAGMERGAFLFAVAPFLGVPALLAALVAVLGRRAHGPAWVGLGLASLALYLMAALFGFVSLGSGAPWRVA